MMREQLVHWTPTGKFEGGDQNEIYKIRKEQI
jgi:hypothetical protein